MFSVPGPGRVLSSRRTTSFHEDRGRASERVGSLNAGPPPRPPPPPRQHHHHVKQHCLSSRSPVSATRAALVHHVPSEGPRALLSGSPRPPTPGLGATSLRNCLLRPPMHRRSCIELGGANCLSGFRTVFPPLATLIEVRKIGERGIRSLDLMRETEGLLQRGQPGERVVGGGLSTYEARREEFIYWLNE